MSKPTQNDKLLAINVAQNFLEKQKNTAGHAAQTQGELTTTGKDAPENTHDGES